MNDKPCGCCEGVETLTPQATANRPGLDALAYRAGTHATFLETMKARLSNLCLGDEEACQQGQGPYPLQGLTTRDPGDPAIAMLDAWATVGDVLTFYQERIANEGYLLTATERRSILELARLVGYRLRPGVAASVYLAFELEKDAEVEIPAGTRAQSLPGPGQLPQPFETAGPLLARAEWNALKPRMTRPQLITRTTRTLYLQGTSTNLKPNSPILIDFGDEGEPESYRVVTVEPDPAADRTTITYLSWEETQPAAAGAAPTAMIAARRPLAMPPGLHLMTIQILLDMLAEYGGYDPKDLAGLGKQIDSALLATFTTLARAPASHARDDVIGQMVAVLSTIRSVVEKVIDGSEETVYQTPLHQMLVWIDTALGILAEEAAPQPGVGPITNLSSLADVLAAPRPLSTFPPKDPSYLRQDPKVTFGDKSDVRAQLLTRLRRIADPVLYKAWRNAKVAEPDPVRVYALRTTASLFGHNAPKEPQYEPSEDESGATNPNAGDLKPWDQWPDWDPDEDGNIIYLDGVHDRILPGPESYIVVDMPDAQQPQVFGNITVNTRSRAAYGLSAKTTEIILPNGELWWDGSGGFDIIRGTIVHAQSELLDLAEEQIDTVDHPEPIQGNSIELGGLYDGLKPGRWLVVSGERTALPGVTSSELVMLAGVDQYVNEALPGDAPHTTLVLDNELAHIYKRDTVTVHGNVVKATHGETREEVLGSGDGTKGRQQFTLKQSPLTYLAAPTPAGAESTLQVRVNNVLWHETERLVDRKPADRAYITQADNEDRVTLTFGDGQHGARLPTGVENVRAVYRMGIGQPGNVRAQQISLLATRPLGVKGVINPLPATGGADRESRDQARRNVPLAILALDRLVSVEDYADFCRTYAGIAKASATQLSDGRREVVHLTIAGVDDIPIEPISDLYRNLYQALRRYGDPRQAIQIDLRELMLLVVRARVRLHPDYIWESVAPKIRTALLEAFGFEHRELGQDVLLAELILTIQQVPGVDYVDVDLLESISESEAEDEKRLSAKLAELAAGGGASGNGAGLRPRPRIPVQLARLERVETLHLIKPGDTLWSLARRYGTTVAELVRLNKIADPNLIYSGRTLLIRTQQLIRQAQLAILSPKIPETLYLEEIVS